MDAFALMTGFPLTYFQRPPTEEFPLGSLLFRLMGASVQDRNEMYQYAQVAFDMVRRMIELIRSRSAIATFAASLSDGPVVVAEVTRSELGLSPDTPIGNLTNTLEEATSSSRIADHVRSARCIFPLGGDRARRPIMVLSGGKPMDRLRFNMAHELGHLVMHQPLRSTVAQVEPEAHRFAAEV